MQLTQSDLMKQNEPMSISINGYELEIFRVAELSERTMCFVFSLPYYRGIYVFDGNLNVYCEGSIVELSKGDICFIGPNIKTRYMLDTAVRARFIDINFNIAMTSVNNQRKNRQMSSFDIRSRLNIITENKHITVKGQQELSGIIRAIRAESTSRSAGKDLVIASLYFNFIIHGLRFVGTNCVFDKEREAGKDFVMELIKYVKDNVENGITLTDVSRHLNMSQRHVCRLVKENLGLTFHEMLQEIRIFYLQKYLKETNLPMQAVSERIGYSSPRAVYNLLKKYNKMGTNTSGASKEIKLPCDIVSTF